MHDSLWIKNVIFPKDLGPSNGRGPEPVLGHQNSQAFEGPMILRLHVWFDIIHSHWQDLRVVNTSLIMRKVKVDTYILHHSPQNKTSTWRHGNFTIFNFHNHLKWAIEILAIQWAPSKWDGRSPRQQVFLQDTLRETNSKRPWK